MDHSILQNILTDQLDNFVDSRVPMLNRRHSCLPLFKFKEAVLITGVRRCGKSSLMKIAAQELARTGFGGKAVHICYLDLDDPRLISLTVSDLQTVHELWLKSRPSDAAHVFVFLDEPQNVVGWERWVTYLAGQSLHHVVVTGSNSSMLSSDLATSLTGRHRQIELLPFTFREILNDPGDPHGTAAAVKRSRQIDLYFQYGGFPRAFLDKDCAILAQYFKDIVMRDIVPRKGSGTSREMLELGNVLFSNNTRTVNKSKLAQQLGFKQQRTVSKYISYFLDAFLIYEIRKFDASVRRQVRSLPKFYAADPALAGAVGFRVLDDQSSRLENFVFLELKARGYDLSYALTGEGWEVDFIARKSGQIPLALQVSLHLDSPDIRKREVRALLAAARQYSIDSLFIVTMNDREVINEGGCSIAVVPFGDWASDTSV